MNISETILDWDYYNQLITTNWYLSFIFLFFIGSVSFLGVNLFKNNPKHEEISKKINLKKKLPGPKPIPILGSLHLMGEYDIPFQAFTELRKKYGDIFSIQLGMTDCVVVNNLQLRDEVLINKGSDFDGRPNFVRIGKLFGGNRQNALAFCDFDPLQNLRRNLIGNFTFPHSSSSLWNKLDEVSQLECQHLQEYITTKVVSGQNVLDMKMLLLKASANVFHGYFCGAPRMEYDNSVFVEYVDNFDKVFWEVNTGRISDFIPWLALLTAIPTYKSVKAARNVREFVERVILGGRRINKGRMLLLDDILPFINGSKTEMNHDTAIYLLEDILGGHCAVGCMSIRVLFDLAKHSEDQNKIINEIKTIGKSQSNQEIYSFSLADKLHRTRASVFETIRLTCSPIVPHRAMKDSSIGGYLVKKNTVIFINNHELSFSEKYWNEGDTDCYKPERFIKKTSDSDEAKFSRPIHFKPFSLGRRSCLGYKIVETLCQAFTTAILQKFRIELDDNNKLNKLPVGLLGLPPNQINMRINLI